MASTPRIGINLPREPRPDGIRSNLRRFVDAGFELVELPLDLVPLIVRGERKDEYVRVLKNILKEFPLGYTAHIGDGVDLRDRSKAELHGRVVRSSVEICRELGASPLVLHYEAQTRDLEIERRFLEAHRRIATLAASLGVGLCVENIEVDRFEWWISSRSLRAPL